MRKQLIAANWKMNKTFGEVETFLTEFNYSEALAYENIEILICPTFVFLPLVSAYYNETGIFTGAQNISHFEKGAYTGEVSAMQLASLSVTHAIIGHSERRKYFHEDNEILAHKINMALQYNITPLFCCGEQLEERNSEIHFSVVEQQLEQALFHLNSEQLSKIIIAYEPVWAIGTGVNATAEQAQEMHAFIRSMISKRYDEQLANNIRILYGGSCNPLNAAELFSCPDVDGGLIGGASLNPNDFFKLITIAHETNIS